MTFTLATCFIEPSISKLLPFQHGANVKMIRWLILGAYQVLETLHGSHTPSSGARGGAVFRAPGVGLLLGAMRVRLDHSGSS